MKIKVTGFIEIDGLHGIRIDGTKTDWNDLPYQNENGEWQNQGKMFHIAMRWYDDPIEMGKMLDAGLQELLKELES